MNKPRSIIYVPGLGDANPRGQRLLVSLWRLWAIKPVFFHIKWGDGEAFTPKLERLLKLIDDEVAQGNSVSLVGASGGAGAVINAFAERKAVIVGVICIAGKVNNSESIGPRYSTGNPAFVESARMVQPSLNKLDFDTDRTRVQSRYAIFDPIVPRGDSVIAGAINRTVPSIGHVITIATQLFFGVPFWLHFLKRIQR